MLDSLVIHIDPASAASFGRFLIALPAVVLLICRRSACLLPMLQRHPARCLKEACGI